MKELGGGRVWMTMIGWMDVGVVICFLVVAVRIKKKKKIIVWEKKVIYVK